MLFIRRLFTWRGGLPGGQASPPLLVIGMILSNRFEYSDCIELIFQNFVLLQNLHGKEFKNAQGT